MSIDRFLTHTVHIERRDQSGSSVDDYNQPVVVTPTIGGIAAGIQPRSVREMAAVSQAGAAMSDTRIYMLPRDVRTADVIVHDPDDCPVSVDLPLGRYEVVGVPDAAGAGHHVEVWAKLVAAPGYAYAVAGGGGS